MPVGKVATPQIRQNAPSAAPAKPKPAAAAAQTTAAGWGNGAKATSLKITLATIDEGPAATPGKIALPKGFKAEIKPNDVKLSDTVGGKKVSYEESNASLNISGPGGKKFAVWSDNTAYTADWKSEVAAQKKEPTEYSQLDWSYERSFSGAGTAGKMVSIQENSNDYMGGAHPNHATRMGTFDTSTGKQVKLEDILTQQQMAGLVKDIAKQLPKLKGPEDVDGQTFNMGGDAASIRDTINSNFALVADKNGKVKIDISWESGVHALGPLMAHFQVDAPNDPAFRSKIGLE